MTDISGVSWVDGTLVDAASATVPVLSNAVMRGSAVFDVMRVLHTGAGPAVLGLRPHVARFDRSMTMMGMTSNIGLGVLERAIAETVQANPGASVVKIVATWADWPGGLVPLSSTPRITIGVVGADQPEPVIAPSPPLRLRSATAAKAHPDALPPGLKVAGSYTVGVRETMRARSDGLDGVLFRTMSGELAEGATQSGFVVSGDRVMAPPLDIVLDGITRRLILDLASHRGFHTEVRGVLWDEVLAADELFLCSTTNPVAPVETLDDRAYQAPGPVTAALHDAVLDLVADPGHPLARRWLTPLPS